MSFVQTPAARPYGVSLARAIASSRSANSMAASTGPKISSREIVISGVTSAKTVGLTKYPLPVPMSVRSPPATSVAPSFLPDSM
jgi:hypothetical protein